MWESTLAATRCGGYETFSRSWERARHLIKPSGGAEGGHHRRDQLLMALLSHAWRAPLHRPLLEVPLP